jgi:N-acetylglucosamine kinase-like BadF-type ATPase
MLVLADIGGTKAEFVVANLTGKISHRWVAFPPENINKLPTWLKEQWTFHRKLLEGVDYLCIGTRGVWFDTECDGVVQGIEKEQLGNFITFVIPDIQGAYYSEFTEPGSAVLVGGTGSIAVVLNPDGTWFRVGGYGSLVGDRGSAMDIGKQTLLRIVKLQVEDKESSPLMKEIQNICGASSWRELLQTRTHLASFFPIVHNLAKEGDFEAIGILYQAAQSLALLLKRIILYVKPE